MAGPQYLVFMLGALGGAYSIIILVLLTCMDRLQTLTTPLLPKAKVVGWWMLVAMTIVAAGFAIEILISVKAYPPFALQDSEPWVPTETPQWVSLTILAAFGISISMAAIAVFQIVILALLGRQARPHARSKVVKWRLRTQRLTPRR